MSGQPPLARVGVTSALVLRWSHNHRCLSSVYIQRVIAYINDDTARCHVPVIRTAQGQGDALCILSKRLEARK
jgi:hypothetical protein